MKRNTIPKNNEFITQAILNDKTYIDFMQRLKNVAITMFEWVNLPSSMNERFLEECLYYNGQAVMLKDKKYGFINTKCSSSGKLNIYGLPVELNCYSFSYNTVRTLYTGLKNEDNTEDKQCILVMNNWDRIPTEYSMQLFSYRLYLAQRSIDVNIQAQRTPIMILTTDKQRLTMRNLYLQYDGNEPFIFGDKNLIDNDMIKAIKTEAPYVEDKISAYKKDILNEALSFLGINNINVEKKERLVEDEANANNEYVNLNLMSRLVPRKEACKKFNELFNPKDKIDVRLRSDLKNIIKSVDSIVDDFVDKQLKDIEGDLNE